MTKTTIGTAAHAASGKSFGDGRKRGNVGLNGRRSGFNDIMWQLVFYHLQRAGGAAAQGFDDVIYEVVREERS